MHSVPRILAAIVLGGVVHGEPAGPPTHSPFYWSFWAPRDFMSLLGNESSRDPFASGGEPPPTASPSATWKEQRGFFEVGSVEDASPVLVAAGVPWDATQDMAFLHPDDQRLYIRCSRDTAEMVDEFMRGVRPSQKQNIEIEVLLIGLTDPGAFRTLTESDDARTAAESLAADRGRIVARASVLTRSGHRASFGQGRPPAAVAPQPASEPTTTAGTAPPQTPIPVEAGLSLQAEPSLGADGNTIDLSIQCSFGLRVAPGDGAPITGDLVTRVTVRSDQPVLQRLSLEGAPWPEVAVVLSAGVKLADVDGWKNGVLQLLPREKAWRALGAPDAKRAGP